MLTTVLIPAATQSAACLLVLHGLGDSLEGWRWLPEALDLPWLNYLLVNAPDPYFGGFSWYDFATDSEPGIHRSRSALTEMLDRLRAEGTPADQLAILGFSQGCLMTLETGFRYSEPLAALVGISGYVWQPEMLLRQMPPAARRQRALVTHGRGDRVVSIEPVKAQIATLQGGGLSIEWHEFDKAHTIAGETEICVIRDFLTRCFAR